MKQFLDHSFRYAVFFLSLFVLYAGATGFKKPDSTPLLYAAAVLLAAAVMGMVVAGVALLFRRHRNR